MTMDPDDDVTSKPYYFSKFRNTDEAAAFVKMKSRDIPGHYLLRPSFKNPHNLTISALVADKTVRHTNIIVCRSGRQKFYYLVKEKPFSSIEQLLDYYSKNEVKNLEKVSQVRFLYPITHGRSSVSSSEHVIPENKPPLPNRPSLLRLNGSEFGSTSSLASTTSNTSSVPRARGDSIDSTSSSVACRPPLPLPPIPTPKTNPNMYSTPAPMIDRTEALKEALRRSERCDCGIPMELAELPLNWTVHRSKDAQTYGRLFFQNSEGLTSWRIPKDVEEALTPQQGANLQQLYNEYQEMMQKRQLNMPTRI